tara:strand:- start:5116 stop:6111 length:996 start_codon:yes stop_codon:yes gene_type:complete
MFKNKVLLITGGTGSFGNAMVDKILNSNISQIRIFSRDEKKQDDMRRKYNNEKLKFYLGDVRDKESIAHSMKDVNYVFHAAALKQVPSCEFYPNEAIKTNAIGASNVIDTAINSHVEKIVCLSTDKAVYPINAMGMTKALMEKIAISKSRISNKTKILITRYGNVIGSRGSVIPLFHEKIVNDQPITITDPLMTRFMMTLEDAVDLVLYAFDKGKSGEILVKKSPGATIQKIAESLILLNKKNNHSIKIIGTRHGEKKHETLLTAEERIYSKENDDFYIIAPDNRNLNYEEYFSKGSEKISNEVDYSSNNTNQLNVNDLVSLIKKSQSLTI